MRSLLQPERRVQRAALLLPLLSISALLALAHIRGSWRAVAGDESTFLAMAESLARDGDLAFTESDRARLEVAEPATRRSVILQRVDDRIAFSKPAIYPLVAAPWLALFGRPGLVALNALALGGALWLFWRLVRARPGRSWVLTIATFAATGAVLPQIAWSTGDALQLALALGGAVLALGDGARSGRVEAASGGLLLGLLVAMRLPNLLVVLAVPAALIAAGRARRAVAVAIAAAAGFAVAVLLNVALIGGANPYRTERATFNAATGYPAGAGGEAALTQFVEGRATQRLGARPAWRPRSSAYAGVYFLIGRHTGVLVYFPIAIVLLGAALRGADGARRVLLLGAIGLAGFYLIWLPENYFGGASFVGNRYLLPALALLLPALERPPRVGWLAAVWALSAATLVSAFASVVAERGKPFSSQSHAYAGLFRALPYESTALSIADRDDRYYSDEFLRFVDRNAEVREHGFRLRAGEQPAEILLATPRPSGVLRFLVRVEASNAELVYRDWRGEQRFALESDGESAGGAVEIVAAPAWRRHPFWWTDRPWRAHAVRLSIDAPAGESGRADVRYLGPYRLASKFFAYEVLEATLPATVPAGGVSSLRVRLANRGRRPWASAADVPVHLAHRVGPVSGTAGAGARLRFVEIDRVVEPGEVLELEVERRWPRAAGRYRVELDLVLGGVARFRDWMGGPLAAATIEVVTAVPATSAVVSSD